MHNISKTQKDDMVYNKMLDCRDTFPDLCSAATAGNLKQTVLCWALWVFHWESWRESLCDQLNTDQWPVTAYYLICDHGVWGCRTFCEALSEQRRATSRLGLADKTLFREIKVLRNREDVDVESASQVFTQSNVQSNAMFDEFDLTIYQYHHDLC